MFFIYFSCGELLLVCISVDDLEYVKLVEKDFTTYGFVKTNKAINLKLVINIFSTEKEQSSKFNLLIQK